jgi:hypothetical protein
MRGVDQNIKNITAWLSRWGEDLRVIKQADRPSRRLTSACSAAYIQATYHSVCCHSALSAHGCWHALVAVCDKYL